MKNFLESSQTLSAQAEMDFCYWRLEELNKPGKPRSGIEIAVDIATGFQDSKDLQKIKDGLYYLRHILKCEKILEIETARTEEVISSLLTLRKELKKKSASKIKSNPKFKRINP